MKRKSTYIFKFFILLLTPLMQLSCNGGATPKSPESNDSIQPPVLAEYYVERSVEKVDTMNLVVYKPTYSNIHLVCGSAPDGEENLNEIYCAAAAFTGEGYENGFNHKLIAGNHTSDGIYHKGYRCVRNTGAFVYYSGQYQFIYGNYADELQKAATLGGMGFAQEMMIHQGKQVETYRKAGNPNIFRALCELDSKICIIESTKVVRFGDFICAMKQLGVTEALYLDMGSWSYSWYRNKKGETIHTFPHNRTLLTNCIVFSGPN